MAIGATAVNAVDLNTSHVKIQGSLIELLKIVLINLNTSHVKVQEE